MEPQNGHCQGLPRALRELLFPLRVGPLMFLARRLAYLVSPFPPHLSPPPLSNTSCPPATLTAITVLRSPPPTPADTHTCTPSNDPPRKPHTPTLPALVPYSSATHPRSSNHPGTLIDFLSSDATTTKASTPKPPRHDHLHPGPPVPDSHTKPKDPTPCPPETRTKRLPTPAFLPL